MPINSISFRYIILSRAIYLLFQSSNKNIERVIFVIVSGENNKIILI